MSRCNTDLSQTSALLTLDAWDGSDETLGLKPLMSVSAGSPTWRIVEIASRTPAPFEVHLSWGAAGAAVAAAKVTVSRCTRIGVYARSLSLSAGNLHSTANTIVVAVADSASFVQTRNQYEYRGTIENDGTTSLDIPPFASHVRLDCHDPAELANMRLRLVDGQGTTRLYLPADQLPQDGVPVGSAHKVQVTHVTAGAVFWRAVFLLNL